MPRDGIIMDSELFVRHSVWIQSSNFHSMKRLVWECDPVNNIKSGYQFPILVKSNLFSSIVVKWGFFQKVMKLNWKKKPSRKGLHFDDMGFEIKVAYVVVDNCPKCLLLSQFLLTWHVKKTLKRHFSGLLSEIFDWWFHKLNPVNSTAEPML